MSRWGPIVFFALVGALLIGFTGAVQAWRYGAKISELKAQHAEQEREHAEALANAHDETRKAEQELSESMEAVANETVSQIEAVRSFERDLYDGRVRELAAEYAARYRSHAAATTAAIDRQAADAAITMFAVMLGELEELAAVYSIEADERRVNGLSCEAHYELARKKLADLQARLQ